MYGYVLRAQIRSQTQYRTSFAVEVIGSVLLNGLDLATVFVLFSVAGSLGGFGGTEVFLLTTLSACAFAVADLVVGNADKLRDYVRTGLFDTVLLRPLSALWQLLAVNFAPRRVGRAVQGLVLYVVALAIADIDWDLARAVYAVGAPVAGAVFFGSFFIAGSTVAFWWVESGEMANAFTYGGRDFSAYPSTMYGGWFRAVFANALGFGFVAYLPTLALVGRADPLGAPDWLRWCSPAIALIAAGLAALFWRTGVRHYQSTGS